MIGDALGQAAQAGVVVAGAHKKFAELRKATDGMQTAFVKTMVAELQKETQKEFENLPGSDIYNDMQNQVISEKLTATGHLGVSDTLFKPMANLAYKQELTSQTVKYNQQQLTAKFNANSATTNSPSMEAAELVKSIQI